MGPILFTIGSFVLMWYFIKYLIGGFKGFGSIVKREFVAHKKQKQQSNF
jgi:prolipoprotein diacylglyceryltransferase